MVVLDQSTGVATEELPDVVRELGDEVDPLVRDCVEFLVDIGQEFRVDELLGVLRFFFIILSTELDRYRAEYNDQAITEESEARYRAKRNEFSRLIDQVQDIAAAAHTTCAPFVWKRFRGLKNQLTAWVRGHHEHRSITFRPYICTEQKYFEDRAWHRIVELLRNANDLTVIEACALREEFFERCPGTSGTRSELLAFAVQLQLQEVIGRQIRRIPRKLNPKAVLFSRAAGMSDGDFRLLLEAELAELLPS